MQESKERLNPRPEIAETTVFMRGLSSIEHYAMGAQKFIQVLKDINLVLRRAESWGIYGQSPFEIKLLLEIMANIVPYQDGRCVLVEKGMMRRKRVVLDHVFYIGTSTMPYDNMNVLEFLMFATAQQKGNPLHRQEEIFELLLRLGLGYISLTIIKRLTHEEKAIVTLMAAAFSRSAIIVFNLPEFEFNEVLRNALEKLSYTITKTGKTLVLGTRDSLLIEGACTHTAYVRDGAIIYQGEVGRLCLNYDHLLMTVRDENVLQLKNSLQVLLPRHRFSIVENRLMIYENSECKSGPLLVYQKIIETGLAPQRIKINPKTVKNAYEEIDRQYDLRKQLFE